MGEENSRNDAQRGKEEENKMYVRGSGMKFGPCMPSARCGGRDCRPIGGFSAQVTFGQFKWQQTTSGRELVIGAWLTAFCHADASRHPELTRLSQESSVRDLRFAPDLEIGYSTHSYIAGKTARVSCVMMEIAEPPGPLGGYPRYYIEVTALELE